jgi:LCP family protein required for cell wall assembly
MINLNLKEHDRKRNKSKSGAKREYNMSDKDFSLKSSSNDKKQRRDKIGKNSKLRQKLLMVWRPLWKVLPVFIFMFSIVGLWFSAKNMARGAGLELTVKDTIRTITKPKEEPELKRDSSGQYTNVLLVGIDTRETNSGLKNTDTIMVASYNHETSDIVMISIPRDFHAEIPGENYYVKINSLYNLAESKKKGTGLPILKRAAENVTDLEIQYFAMVDLKGFKKSINEIGGIEVNVERSFTDYQYPNPNGPGYITVSFEKGPQTMDGQTALQYARSRKSLGPEGSDYARARRQQRVISAARDKVLSSDTYLNPKKVISLIQSVSDNVVTSEYTTEDIRAAINIAENLEDSETYSVVLDPLVGNSQLVTTGVVSEGYSIGPTAGLGNYEDIHHYISGFLENPALYEAQPTINVYDIGAGYYPAYETVTEFQEKYPYLSIIYRGTLYSGKSGSIIYANNEEISEEVVSEIQTELNIQKNEIPEYIDSNLNGEDIVILLGRETTTTESSEANN